jgi:hypothetical protein
MTSPSAEYLAQSFEMVGSWGLRLGARKGLGAGSFTELPTANEAYRNLICVVPGGTGVADQMYYCRKNADESYEWVSVGVSDATLVLLLNQSVDESSNPQNLQALDPSAQFGTLNLAKFTQARLRAVIAGGTDGVTGTVQYTDDAFSTFATFLANTIDFSEATHTTAWEDIPAGAIGADIFIGLRFSVAGTGSATATVNLFLDLRG